MDLERKLDAVRARLGGLGSVLVAFSGGADSALVLALAHEVLGERAAAAIGVSAAYPQTEIASARATAAHIGVRLLEIPTSQLEDLDFLRNDDTCVTAFSPQNGWRSCQSGRGQSFTISI